jgi:hypothetical protein
MTGHLQILYLIDWGDNYGQSRASDWGKQVLIDRMIIFGFNLFIATKIYGSINHNSSQTDKITRIEHSIKTFDC